MKKNKVLIALLFLLPLIIVSCKDEKEEPLKPSTLVSKNLFGSWLLSSSEADNWTVYEFTETSRLNVEMLRDGNYLNGSGFYSVDEKKSTVTGSFSINRNQEFYIDWIVKANSAFQIDFEQYDSQLFLCNASVYRVVANLEVQVDDVISPKYRDYTGYYNCSGFSSLDSSKVTVDAATGDITGHKEGITYVVFETQNGKAAIKVSVGARQKTLQELIVGVWIYDNRNEHEWQKTEFLDDETMSVEWKLDNNDEIAGFGTGRYTVSANKINFTVNATDGTQISQEWRIETFNDYDCIYECFAGNAFVGKYAGHRLLKTMEMSPGEMMMPNYQTLLGDLEVRGYKTHNEIIATVSDLGNITANSKGTTYVEIITDRGTAFLEVIVKGGAIPYDFQDCIGKAPSKLKEMLGTPYYEDGTIIMYKNLTNTIDMVGASIDSFSGLIKGVTITYNSNVKTDDVTSILDATFIPFTSQTTATFKAYMDTAERADASIGVTWDIPTKTLTYVNLATELFTDYSVLIGMTRSQVVSKMGKEPDTSNDQSQSFFFFDKKGIMIVSAYYTDFVNNYDNVRSVVTMFDDTLTAEQITNYLKKKYPYYPEYSTDDELVFVPDGHALEIYYKPKDKMIMYISTSNSSKALSSASVALKLKSKTNSIKK